MEGMYMMGKGLDVGKKWKMYSLLVYIFGKNNSKLS
jgi:hypothetical protein